MIDTKPGSASITAGHSAARQFADLAGAVLLLLAANPSTPAWSAAPGAAVGTPRIPLCPGLTLVTAIRQNDGDYESIKRIVATSSKSTLLHYSAETKVHENEFEDESPLILKDTETDRDLLADDLQHAKLYMLQFDEGYPKIIPRTTAIGISRSVFSELKTKGEANLDLIEYSSTGGDEKEMLAPDGPLSIYSGGIPYRLKREPKQTSLNILVNGVPRDLPVMHVIGESDAEGGKVEFYFLDDAENPLSLQYRLGIGRYAEVNQYMVAETGKPSRPTDDGAQLQVVRISYSCAGYDLPAADANAETPQAAAIEQSLQQSGKVDIYDIFFNFDRATLRPDSEPTLKAIAEVMTRHPTWRFTIAGHTDNIAGDAYNLDLSNRRAAATKAALTGRLHIDGARIDTVGYGASQPRASNATLEGRARNRRVELIRQ